MKVTTLEQHSAVLKSRWIWYSSLKSCFALSADFLLWKHTLFTALKKGDTSDWQFIYYSCTGAYCTLLQSSRIQPSSLYCGWFCCQQWPNCFMSTLQSLGKARDLWLPPFHGLSPFVTQFIFFPKSCVAVLQGFICSFKGWVCGDSWIYYFSNVWMLKGWA